VPVRCHVKKGCDGENSRGIRETFRSILQVTSRKTHVEAEYAASLLQAEDRIPPEMESVWQPENLLKGVERALVGTGTLLANQSRGRSALARATVARPLGVGNFYHQRPLCADCALLDGDALAVLD
jgi:hypothetical protein